MPLPLVFPALSRHCKLVPPTKGDAKKRYLLPLAGIYLSAVIFPLMVPLEIPILAVPVAFDSNVKNPAVLSVVLEPTITVPGVAPPTILSALPKVAVAVPESVKSFKTLVVPRVVWSK